MSTDASSVVRWVVEHGGFWSNQIRVGSGRRGRGIFATEPIMPGRLLLSVPVSLAIPQQPPDNHACRTIAALRKELELGPQSFYWPFLLSIQNVTVDIPDAWSAEERMLLDGLPPGDWRAPSRSYADACVPMGMPPLESDALTTRALMLFTSRSGPLGMQPLFDLLNHGHNSTTHRVTGGQHAFYAVRPHRAGEELLNTFRSGAGVGRALIREMRAAGSEPVATTALFRDYGFFDEPPVKWEFRAPATGELHGFVIEALGADSNPGSDVVLAPSGAPLDALDSGEEADNGTEDVAWARRLARDAQEKLDELRSRAAALAHAIGPYPWSARVQLARDYRAAFERALEAVVATVQRLHGAPAAQGMEACAAGAGAGGTGAPELDENKKSKKQ